MVSEMTNGRPERPAAAVSAITSAFCAPNGISYPSTNMQSRKSASSTSSSTALRVLPSLCRLTISLTSTTASWTSLPIWLSVT